MTDRPATFDLMQVGKLVTWVDELGVCVQTRHMYNAELPVDIAQPRQKGMSCRMHVHWQERLQLCKCCKAAVAVHKMASYSCLAIKVAQTAIRLPSQCCQLFQVQYAHNGLLGLQKGRPSQSSQDGAYRMIECNRA